MCLRHPTAAIYDGSLVTVETERDSIDVTAYHPFWVISGRDLAERPDCRELDPREDQGHALRGRWVNSHDLRPGDTLYDRHGQHVTIKRVSQVYNPTVPVSNLTIEDHHNYAVGNLGILVHNVALCQEGIDKAVAKITRNPENIDNILGDLIQGGVDRNSLEEILERSEKTPSQSILDAIKNAPRRTGARFGSDAKLQDHFTRHGGDFGTTSASQYETMADGFLTGPRPVGVLEKVRPNGDVVRFNPATDEFGVVSGNGTIRTYYKPDPAVHGYATNLDYFNAQ